MLRITVELLPHGSLGEARFMGQAEIWNDDTGDAQLGNYEVTFSTWHDPPRPWKRGRVVAFDRKNRGPWDLIFRALCAAGIATRNQGRPMVQRGNEGH